MSTVAELLLQQGVRPRHYRDGNQKLVCPRCSRDRKKRTDPCLSLTIEGTGAVWKCHHSDWAGSVDERHADRIRERNLWRPPRPHAKPSKGLGELTPTALHWLADRGISEATARRNRIGTARVYFPTLKAEAEGVAFPYFRAGELVNIKFRAIAEKAFTQVRDAEKIFYGLDDIANSEAAIIVEGEVDKLALDEAGMANVDSVPDGAPSQMKSGEPAFDDAKFSYLATCADNLDRLHRVILAIDSDGPGDALAEELARRLGKERCWRVRWPNAGDAPCKDANETLIALCSFENPLEEHIAKLAEKYLGLPFSDGPNPPHDRARVAAGDGMDSRSVLPNPLRRHRSTLKSSFDGTRPGPKQGTSRREVASRTRPGSRAIAFANRYLAARRAP